jgi:hypothetical protein
MDKFATRSEQERRDIHQEAVMAGLAALEDRINRA